MKYLIKKPFAGYKDREVVEVNSTDAIVGCRTDYLLELGAIELIPDTPKHPLLWKPKERERYHYISAVCIGYHEWDNDSYDIEFSDSGNCYPTREAAEHALARQKAIVRVSRAILELNAKVDISELDYPNLLYYIYHNGDIFRINWFLTDVNMGTILPPMRTEDIAKTIITTHRDDLALIYN